MSSHWRCGLFLVLAAAGCAGPRASLQVLSLAAEQSLSKRLKVDGTLRSGDQFLLKVKVPRPAYVYAFPPGSRRTGAALPPARAKVRPRPESADGDTLVSPEEPLYIPGPGQYFTLDEAVGRE